MSGDFDLLELLNTQPAPSMHVDLDAVVAEGRRRRARRTAGWVTTAAAAAVVTAVVATLSLASDDGKTTTPPAGTTTTVGRHLSVDGNGGTVLIGQGGTYGIGVTGGTTFTQVNRRGQRPRLDDPTGVVLPSGAAWLVVKGARGWPAIVGVVPAGATDINIVAPAGLPAHTVVVGHAGDFEAFLVEFAKAPDGHLLASDVTWHEGSSARRALAKLGGTATFDVAGAGLLTVALSGSTLGDGTVRAELDGAALPSLPLTGDTPTTSFALGKRQLPGGHVLVWGVVPQQTLSVRARLGPGATAGTMATRPLGGDAAYLAYAEVVTGRVQDVTGLQSTDRSGTGIGFVE